AMASGASSPFTNGVRLTAIRPGSNADPADAVDWLGPLPVGRLVAGPEGRGLVGPPDPAVGWPVGPVTVAGGPDRIATTASASAQAPATRAMATVRDGPRGRRPGAGPEEGSIDPSYGRSSPLVPDAATFGRWMPTRWPISRSSARRPAVRTWSSSRFR